MFRFFRRYQKTFIVIGGVILMFVFTVGDTISQWMASQSGGEGRVNPKATAVSWDGGKLSEAELSGLLRNRRLAGTFISFAYQEGARRAMDAGLTDRHRVVPIAQFNRDTPLEALERDVVRRYILAERAEDMGIVISDQEVQNYISEIGLRMLDGADVQSLLSALGGGGQAPSATQLFNAIRHELMAEAGLRALGSSGTPLDLFAAEMPVDRWEEWKQMNDQIVIEAAAINPASAMLDVEDPTDEELRDYFEKYKDSTGAPVPLNGLNYLPSPEPGFKIPRKVKLAYLRANYDAFLERFEKEVTDEQISEYYEENKFRFPASRDLEAFNDLDSDDTDSGDTESEGDEAEATDEEMADESEGTDSIDEPVGEESTTEETEDETPPTDESEGEETVEEEDAPATESAEEESATEEAAAEDTPGEEPATEAPAEEPSGESNALKNSPFRLASFQETEETAETEAPETEEAEASEETNETSEPESTSEASADEAAEAEETTETEEAETEDTSEEETSEDSSDETMEDEDEATDSDEPQFAPLEEVADDIRRLLAEDRFDSEIQEIMRSAVRRLKPAYSKYLKSVLDANARGEDPPTPPEALTDLSPIAEELSLEFEETVELSLNELLETPVGKSLCPDIFVDDRPAMITQVAFTDKAELYEPVLSEDYGRFSPMLGGGYADRYLVLKISDEPARVPSFEEVKDKVRTAWRNEQAAEKALEKAKETAKKAQESGLGLANFFIDDDKVEVTTSVPFALYTSGDFAPTGRVNYRLSQPEALKDVGVEFLSELFKLEEGEVTALTNFDKSIVYVVRAADEVESPEELKSNFLEQTNYWQGRFYFRQGKLRSIRPITQQFLLEDVELEWQRSDQESDSDESDEKDEDSEEDEE